jgi:16S rRNA (cytosine967-C5)-methyltransferase
MIAPARRAALDVLAAVEAGRLDLPEAIARARTALSDERDRALLVTLCTGTLRWRGALDFLIERAANRPLARLDPSVLEILRLSTYQLLHLDRVPAAAVVDDAVSLTRAARKTSAAGFVNAVLRRISRSRGSIDLPPRPAEPDAARETILQYLTATLSHPAWLAERWLDRVGFAAAERWLQYNNRPAVLTLRASTPRIDRDALAARLETFGVATEPTRFVPDGLIVRSRQPLQLPLSSEGLFVAQDEASQLVALLAADPSARRVLDVCASPGGKTLIVAARAPSAVVVAGDLRQRRVQLLSDTVSAVGTPGIHIVRHDALQPLPFAQAFDTVLLDAPCSGLGIIRRDPEIRWRRLPADLPRLAGAQQQMLRHAAAVVRPGGAVVYSTCSSEPEENEEVVDRFLRDAGTAYRLAGPEEVALRLPEDARSLIEPAGYLRTSWRDELDGFFAAVLRRER